MMLVVYYILTVILTKQLVVADEQCTQHTFSHPFFPGASCEDIYNMNPESQDISGYYWITGTAQLSQVYCGMNYTGSSCLNIYNNNPETGDKPGYYRIGTQWTYCNMTETAAGFISTCASMGGGWRRIANVDTSTGGDCPGGWRNDTHSNISFCRPVSDNHYVCSSTFFSTNGTSYQKACGRARGYQKGLSATFWGYHRGSFNIEGNYADGLLLTYGRPRNHIWSYVYGRYDNITAHFSCPCAGGGFTPPPFVGDNYYCEAGATDTIDHGTYYFDDPLWDGAGCITSRCCDNPTQPWFYQQLNGTTTSDIEARICHIDSFDRGSALVDQLELYIQ